MTAATGQADTAAAVTAAYMTSTAALRARLLAVTTATFGVNNYGEAGAATYATVMAPALDAAQQTMAGLTAAYLSHLIGTGPVGVPDTLVTGAALRGVDTTTLLRRPYEQVWTALSQGKGLDQAVAIGQRRAESISVTNLQLARTHAARQALSNSPPIVVGYRRELGNDPHHCALCLLTSNRIYRKSELLPIHPGCACFMSPVFRGEGIPEVSPEAVHDAIRAQLGDKYVNASGTGYRDIVITHDHGELGPVLAVNGQKFTGPSDIPGG